MKGLKTEFISILAIGLMAGSAVGVGAQGQAVPATGSGGCEGPLVEPGV